MLNERGTIVMHLSDSAMPARVLVVDDNDAIRLVLSKQLARQGYHVLVASNGQAALDILATEPCDVVLLDMMMPLMDGDEVLRRLKDNPVLRHIPVVIVSAMDDHEKVVNCINLGAEDYMFKPFDPVLMKARINASLERKRLRDQERTYLAELEVERAKSERLLLNILPQPIVERLKGGASTIADMIPQATVAFADIGDFTPIAQKLTAVELVDLLNRIFSTFDALSQKYNLEKIKTIGDAYMVVGGVPLSLPDDAERVADIALAMQACMPEMVVAGERPFLMRIGIHTGPVVAGVIGSKKFSYDLWGETVNIASRMESHGEVGKIQVSEATYQLLKDKFIFEARGETAFKGIGTLFTYWLVGRRS